MDGPLGVFGRLHPLVLHLPIGFLVLLALLELLSARRPGVAREALRPLAALTAASAILAAATGYALSREAGYEGAAVVNHLRLSLAVAAASALAALLWRRKRAARAALALALVLLLPAGHLGSSIAHGEDWLFAPLSSGKSEDLASAAGPPSFYAREVAPVLAARCAACHGTRKKKGGLSLATPESMLAGGEHGDVLGRGGTRSEILRRLALPLDAEDHMPPPNKAQPSAEELALLEAWISAGAPFEGELALEPGGIAARASASESAGAGLTDAAEAAPPAPPAAVEALASALVHAQPVARDSNELWVDFAAVAADTGDARAALLLEPLSEQVADLSLARSAVTGDTLALLARFPRLRRLDLRATPVGDAGLAALGPHPRLEELVLSETALTDAAIGSLLALPALARVHLWRSGISAEGLGRLRAARPDLEVIGGDEPAAEVLESEGEIELTNELPIPGAPAAASLEPVNATCPVSGSPVVRDYLVVFRGRVVGFCCPDCPTRFWSDPEQFADRLP